MRGQTLDVLLRHQGGLSRPEVPGYEALDANYTWRVTPGLDLSVNARNLLDAKHSEFGGAPNRSVYERNVGLNLVWRL